MGTFGTGPFSSDGALDLLEELTRQPAGLAPAYASDSGIGGPTTRSP